MRPAPRADARTLVRRAYFDLIGLPPPPERVEKFAADPSPGAWAALIDELLAMPQYGERWGRHWLDVARYADTGGYETDIYFRNAWRYRDYVIRSLNEDKPYDRFVREQIAGDELRPSDWELEGSYEMPKAKLEALEARLGTGLYALGPQIHESNMDGRRLAYERLTDWADTTGSVFMGLTFGCARCHDHKFDPLTQRDYFGLQAIFAASREVEIPVAHAMAAASQKQHYPRILAIDEARNAYRLWEERLRARGGPPSSADETERRRLLESIGQAVLALPAAIPDTPGGPWDGLMELPSATVLGHHEPGLAPPVRLLNRGELSRARETVPPALPEILRQATGWRGTFADPHRRRRELALWLTRPDHPLTARVMVNRVWQWHFGQGIVSTANDWGRLGAAPSHPELLDWLASAFANGKMGRFSHATGARWSIKSLHRLMMTSAVYMQSSQPAASTRTGAHADPDNRLLWRMNRRRLEGEALWDAVHSVAGSLNLKMGGRPVVPPLAEEELSPLRDRWMWTVAADPKEHTRRGVYLLVRRNFRFPLFEVFDAPVNSQSCPRRDDTTVAPQALWFLNNRTVNRQAQEWAGRLVRDAGEEPRAWVDRAWALAFARPPSETERAEAVELLDALAQGQGSGPVDASAALAKLPPARAAALVKLCLSLFNLNEFAFVD